ncbi:MAG: hypothetical protein ACI30I_09905 [Parabacteroides sp.]
MKQRLLYALLLLFGVVGMANADIKVTVPQGKAATLTLTQRATDTDTDVPSVKIGEAAVTPSSSNANQKTYTYSIAKNDEADQEIQIVSLYGELKVTGNASKIVVDNIVFSKLTASNVGLEELAFTNANALTTIDVSDNKLTTIVGSALPSIVTVDASNNEIESWQNALENKTTLKTLDLSDNKLSSDLDFSKSVVETLKLKNNKLTSLTVGTSVKTLDISGNAIPKVEDLATTATVTWGTQTLAPPTPYSVEANAQFSVKELADASGMATDVTYTLSDWKKQDAQGNWQSNSDAQKLDANNADLYRFYNASTKVYQHGDYQVTMKTSNRTFIVPFTIEPAKFTFTPAELEHGTITVSKVNSNNTTTNLIPGSGVTSCTVNQGDILSINVDFTSDVNYQFVKFIEAAGLKLQTEKSADWNVAPAYCVVEGKFKSLAEGDEVPYVNAEVKGKAAKMTIPTPDPTKGSIKVQKLEADGVTWTAVNNQAEIPYGTKLKITVTPMPGYQSALVINNAAQTLDDNKKESVVEVPSVTGDMEITASFVTVGKVNIMAYIDNKEIGPGGENRLGKIDFKLAGDGSDAEITMNNGDPVELIVGATYQMTFEIGTVIGVLNEVIMDVVGRLEYTVKEETGKNTYYATFVVPQQDATIYISTKELTEVTIKPREDKSASGSNPAEQYQTYDGDYKPLIYTTDPVGLGDVDVLYQLATGAGYGKQAPLNAGTYSVKYSRKAIGNYEAVAEGTINLVINKAHPTITTVPTVTLNNGTYECKNGVAKFNGKTVEGKFTANAITGADVTKSHLVKVTFTATDAVNFAEVNTYQEVKVGTQSMATMPVKIASPLPNGISVQMLKGTSVPVNSGDKFQQGVLLHLLVSYPEGINPTGVKISSLLGTTIKDGSSTWLNDPVNRVKDFYLTVPAGTDADVLTVTVDNPLKYTYNVAVEKAAKNPVYTGTPIKFDSNGSTDTQGTVTIKKDAADARTLSTVDYQITYKNAAGVAVPLPEEAGDYTICVTIPAGNSYKAFYKEFPAKMTIDKALPMVKKWPVARPIGKGQTLANAALVAGSANVSGTFDWLEADKSKRPEDGQKFEARFIPNNPNYKTVVTPNGTEGSQLDERIEVTVSDMQLVTFSPKNGTLRVVDAYGNLYQSGDPITAGTVLTITATPENGYELQSLTVNGTTYSGSYTVGSESVVIDAQFVQHIVKNIITYAPVNGTITVVDLNGKSYPSGSAVEKGVQLVITATPATGYQFKSLTVDGIAASSNTVTVIFGESSMSVAAEFAKVAAATTVLTFPTEASVEGKGFRLATYGVQTATYNSEVTFKVYSLSADASRIVVKAGTTTLTPDELGNYKVKADADKVISVTLANPTKIPVEVEEQTKNEKGHTLGRVLVDGLAYDKTCYYGDQITLAAMPESGVTFAGWSDDRLATDQLRTVTVTKAMTIKPVFVGSPTGTESIESVQVIGGDHCIVIRGAGEARVTIVSMDGRAQQQTISGDAHISVNAGVYGVILEQGKEVQKVKVIVR